MTCARSWRSRSTRCSPRSCSSRCSASPMCRGGPRRAWPAEELFRALLRKPDVSRRTKQRAADQLITVWDDAALEIDDFAPLLESAWHAANRINSAYGTLLGATETFRLVTEDCSPDVIEF